MHGSRRTPPFKKTQAMDSGDAAAELGVERFRPLDDGELDGEAVLEMAHDLPAHRAQRDLDADGRFHLDLDRGARERQVDDAARILPAVDEMQNTILRVSHSSIIKDALDARLGDEMLFPVYRKLTGTGSKAKYEIIGWVGFVITELDLSGNNEKLHGYFTRVICDGLLSEDPSIPDYGVRIVALVE
jgi:hypothetical protein